MVIFSFYTCLRNQFVAIAEAKLRHCRKIICVMMSLLLVGCAIETRGIASPHEILQPWTEITGAQSGGSLGGIPVQINPASGSDYITLRRPTSISASGNDIYLIDAGLRRIFHYDPFQQTLTPFAPTLPVNVDMRIYVAPDKSVFVTDPAHQQVLHFNWDGSPLPSLVSQGNMAHPVAVVVDQFSGRVLVADGLFNRIIAFDNLGMTLAIFKPRQTLSVATMTSGPDGVYVLDRLARQVVVLGWNGAFLYAFAANELSQPGAIAVSRDNIVFISDDFDNTIKAYRHSTADNNFVIAGKIGSNPFNMDSFNGIAGLAIDDGQLYVADSLNSRVQIMSIDPRAP